MKCGPIWIAMLAALGLAAGCAKSAEVDGAGETDTGTDTASGTDTAPEPSGGTDSDTERGSETEPFGGTDSDSIDTVALSDSDSGTGLDPVYNPGIEWIRVEAGTFVMGSPPDEYGRELNERAHTVTLTRDFEIAATEVTVAQWTALDFDFPAGNGFPCEASDCPAHGISQNSIFAWLDALSEKNGFELCYQSTGDPYTCTGYRLPTEAEWEYAARAGTTAATYNGDLVEGATDAVLDPIAACAYYNQVPTAVASKAPNAWGLYDMLGNLREVAEWGGTYPDGAVTDPYYGPRSDRYLAVRGGYRGGYATECRAASRIGAGLFTNEKVADFYTVAFRPVRTLTFGSAGGTEIVDSDCPETATYSCESVGEEVKNELLSAGSIEPSMHFSAVAVGGVGLWDTTEVAILGASAKPESPTPLLLVGELRIPVDGSPGFIDAFTVNPFVPATANLQAVDVVSLRHDDGQTRFVALLCGDTCFLASSEASAAVAGTFEKIEGSELPTGLMPRDMAAVNGSLVAVGDGAARYTNGSWEVLVAPGTGGAFHRVDARGDGTTAMIIAAGEGGRIAAGDLEIWEEIPSGVTDDLFDVRIVSGYGDRTEFEAVGANGRVVAGTVSARTTCTIFDKDLTHFVYAPNIDASIYISMDADQLFSFSPRRGIPPCLGAAPMEPVVQFDMVACGILYNPLYLTENGLYGTWGCAVH